MRLIAVTAFFTMLLMSCSDPTSPPIPDAVARRLVTAGYVTCMLNPADEVYCWGSNQFGSFAGTPALVFANPPRKVVLPAFKQFSSGSGDHICGLMTDGVAYCWGRATYGQTGTGVVEQSSSALTRVVGDLRFRDITTGQITTCGITVADEAFCWGFNDRGGLGDPSVELDTRNPTPRRVAGGHKWKAIAAGWMHSCGVRLDGVAMCWGNNQNGELGIGALDSVVHLEPEVVAGNHRFAQITAGWRQTCALTTDGRAYCWGLNAFGQLGDGTLERRTSPTPVSGNHRFRQIATMNGYSVEGATSISEVQNSRSHTCAVTVSGNAMCWGRNAFGQLGNNTTTDSPIPVSVVGGLSFDMVGVVSGRTCGLRGGDAWCWGHNDYGQVGFIGSAMTLIPRHVILPGSTP